MNKIDSVLYSGWMVKSPPSSGGGQQKKLGTWKLFQPKWKKRFFVLFKPAGSLPGQFVLNYYSDDQCRKRKGHIDLEQCDQIIESLDLGEWQYVLSIKTVHKSRGRVYYLATDTEEEMTTWVQNLCHACGMKQEENRITFKEKLPATPFDLNKLHASVVMPTPLESEWTLDLEEFMRSQQARIKVTQENSKLSVNSGKTAPDLPPQPPVRTDSVCVSPTNQKTITSQPSPQTPSSSNDSPYIYISQCRSGSHKKKDRRDSERRHSVDSIPDEQAPLPPAKSNSGNGQLPAHQKEESSHDLYDHPRMCDCKEDDDEHIYKFPPVRKLHDQLENEQTDYDVPPFRNGLLSPRRYSDDASGTYDVPPKIPGADQTSYDILPVWPANIEVKPPARPPRLDKGEPYQNVPTNSRCLAGVRTLPASHTQLAQTYDSSKFQSADSNLFFSAPPPPACGQRDDQHFHRYVNAPTPCQLLNSDGGDDMYLPMERHSSISSDVTNSLARVTLSESMYTDMNVRHGDPGAAAMNESVYTDMSKPQPCGLNKNVPPVWTQSSPDRHDTYSVFRTEKTRSFKRQVSSTSQERLTVGHMPSKARHIHLHRKMPDDSTSSEDDEEASMENSQGHKIYKMAPPAPGKSDSELKYLDLKLDDNSEKEMLRATVGPASHSSPTEYREIDFVRTQALNDVRKLVNERKNEDH